MLEIVITHYDEPLEVGEKLLQMLDLQRGVDRDQFRVTIVNDGGNRLPDEYLSGLHYNVRQIDIPHGGVSAARNCGIDNSKAEWLMFCDFDDTFSSVYALRDIVTVLPADGYDMLWCRLLVEDFTDGRNTIYISPEKQRFVFVHGKVYRTAFLRENDIRFDERMNFQEDSLFNAIIVAKTPYTRIGEIKTVSPPYIWVRRTNSVTNSGREDEAIWGHFVRNMAVTEENRKSRPYVNYCGMVTRSVCDVYFMVIGSRASPPLKHRIMSEFVPWIKTRINEFGSVDDETIGEILNISKAELCDDPAEDITFDSIKDWLTSILKLGVN